MADETPEENHDDLFNNLSADLPDEGAAAWIQFNEVYQGLLAGGFSKSEAMEVLTNLMWKMMLESGS